MRPPTTRTARFRLHLGTAVLATSVALSGCSVLGGTSTGSTSAVAARAAAADGVYDASVLHEFSVEVDTDALSDMLATYTETDEKEWITADVTIDGTTFRIRQ